MTQTMLESWVLRLEVFHHHYTDSKVWEVYILFLISMPPPTPPSPSTSLAIIIQSPTLKGVIMYIISYGAIGAFLVGDSNIHGTYADSLQVYKSADFAIADCLCFPHT